MGRHRPPRAPMHGAPLEPPIGMPWWLLLLGNAKPLQLIRAPLGPRLAYCYLPARGGKLARGSRAEPLIRARFLSEPSRAGSFQLASLASLAKIINLWNNNEY
jgi:hypothetical protein